MPVILIMVRARWDDQECKASLSYIVSKGSLGYMRSYFKCLFKEMADFIFRRFLFNKEKSLKVEWLFRKNLVWYSGHRLVVLAF